MVAALDIAGQKFNRLTAIKKSEIQTGQHVKWDFACECGKMTTAAATIVKSGKTKSCGCWKIEEARIRGYERPVKVPLKHGYAKNRIPEYNVWKTMRQRCNNPKNQDYELYGARGISICERWNDFENFLSDMGRRPSDEHSIDRKDNNGNYEPSNCHWTTDDAQANNRRMRRKKNDVHTA